MISCPVFSDFRCYRYTQDQPGSVSKPSGFQEMGYFFLFCRSDFADNRDREGCA